MKLAQAKEGFEKSVHAHTNYIMMIEDFSVSFIRFSRNNKLRRSSMSKKILVMVLALTILVTMIALNYPFQKPMIGAMVSTVSASPDYPIQKNVGDIVYFKCKIKNTGSVTHDFNFLVQWAERGTSYSGGLMGGPITLDPNQESDVLELHHTITSDMAGKNYMVRFAVVDAADPNIIYDTKDIFYAFDVAQLSAVITSYWVE